MILKKRTFNYITWLFVVILKIFYSKKMYGRDIKTWVLEKSQATWTVQECYKKEGKKEWAMEWIKINISLTKYIYSLYADTYLFSKS